jgi:hypothetical protein
MVGPGGSITAAAGRLSNTNGGIVIVQYGNTTLAGRTRWSGTPLLARLGGDPEEASSWSASALMGGSPGGPDPIQATAGPANPTASVLVDVGSPGRYFKGTKEPAPDTAGKYPPPGPRSASMTARPPPGGRSGYATACRRRVALDRDALNDMKTRYSIYGGCGRDGRSRRSRSCRPRSTTMTVRPVPQRRAWRHESPGTPNVQHPGHRMVTEPAGDGDLTSQKNLRWRASTR